MGCESATHLQVFVVRSSLVSGQSTCGSFKEGVYYAVPNAADDGFGKVVVPAFFVAKTFCVLSDFSLSGRGLFGGLVG